MLVQIQLNKSWLENVSNIASSNISDNASKLWLSMVKNGCGQSGHGTLKLTVSQE